MNLSAHLITRRSYANRQNNELPNHNFSVPSYIESVNPKLFGTVAAQYALFESIRQQHYRQTSLLVEAGVQLDGRNDKGQTALICSCIMIENAKLQARFLQLFLEAGADPNLQDWSGMTALMYTVIQEKMEAFLIILKHPKTDIKIEDQQSNTALLHACRVQNVAMVFLLLKAYRQLDGTTEKALQHKNIDNKNAYDIAAINNESDLNQVISTAKQFPDTLSYISISVIDTANLHQLSDGNNIPANDLLDITETVTANSLPDIKRKGSISLNTKSMDDTSCLTSKLSQKLKQITVFPRVLSREKMTSCSSDSSSDKKARDSLSDKKLDAYLPRNKLSNSSLQLPTKSQENAVFNAKSVNTQLNQAQKAKENAQTLETSNVHLPPIKNSLVNYDTIAKSFEKCIL